MTTYHGERELQEHVQRDRREDFVGGQRRARGVCAYREGAERNEH